MGCLHEHMGTQTCLHEYVSIEEIKPNIHYDKTTYMRTMLRRESTVLDELLQTGFVQLAMTKP